MFLNSSIYCSYLILEFIDVLPICNSFCRALKYLNSISALTLRSSTFLAAVTMPSKHFEIMGRTLRSTSAKHRYISPSLTVRRSSMSCRFYKRTDTKVQLHTQNYTRCLIYEIFSVSSRKPNAIYYSVIVNWNYKKIVYVHWNKAEIKYKYIRW